MNCPESGTMGGTIVPLEKRNGERNAERRKPAPMLAFQRNDMWNDTRIPTPERSNPSLEGGTVERRNDACPTNFLRNTRARATSPLTERTP
jgi:hypothetical protein